MVKHNNNANVINTSKSLWDQAQAAKGGWSITGKTPGKYEVHLSTQAAKERESLIKNALKENNPNVLNDARDLGLITSNFKDKAQFNIAKKEKIEKLGFKLDKNHQADTINLAKLMDPNRKKNSLLNIFKFKDPYSLLMADTGGIFKSLLSPLDGLQEDLMGSKLMGNPFMQNIFGKGGENDEEGNPIGTAKRLSDRIVDLFEEAPLIKGSVGEKLLEANNKIISDKFPFVGGITGDILSRYMIPPGEQGSLNPYSVYSSDSPSIDEERMISIYAKDHFNPIAAMQGGVNFAEPTDFYFSKNGGVNKTKEGDLAKIFNKNSNQFGAGGLANPLNPQMYRSLSSDGNLRNTSNFRNNVNPNVLKHGVGGVKEVKGGYIVYDSTTSAKAADKLVKNYNKSGKSSYFVSSAQMDAIKGDYLNQGRISPDGKYFITGGYNGQPAIQDPILNYLSQSKDYDPNWQFAKIISDNYREHNETYSQLLEFAGNADPFWDQSYRHEFAYNKIEEFEQAGIKFIDGAGDYINNKIEEVGQLGYKTSETIANALNKTGLGKIFSPGIKKTMDKFLTKMGFPKVKGQGQDYEGWNINDLRFSNVITINGVEIKPIDFIGYYEEHDYMEAKYPLRKLKVKITKEYVEKGLKIDTTKSSGTEFLHINLYRTFSHAVSQNHDYMTFDGAAVYRNYEVIRDFDGVPDLSKFKTSPKTKARKGKQKDGVGNGASHILSDEVIEITLTAKQEKATCKKMFQGVLKEGTSKVEDIIKHAFNLHYYGDPGESNNPIDKALNKYAPGLSKAIDKVNQVANKVSSLLNIKSPRSDQMTLSMETPQIKDDFDTVKTPMTFHDTVKYYQVHSGHKLYDGGYNIFQDTNNVFIINKKGPNTIEWDDAWDTVVRVTSPELDKHITDLYHISSVSDRVTYIGVKSDDVMPLSDFSYKGTVPQTIFGSAMSIFHNSGKNNVHNTETKTSHIGSAVKSQFQNVKVNEFLVRLPNTYLIFRVGDKIRIEFADTKEKYYGTVKKWAAEQNKEVRCVLLWVTMMDKPLDSTLSNNPVANIMRSIQETTSALSDRFKAETDRLQKKLYTSSTLQELNKTEIIPIGNFSNIPYNEVKRGTTTAKHVTQASASRTVRHNTGTTKHTQPQRQTHISPSRGEDQRFLANERRLYPQSANSSRHNNVTAGIKEKEGGLIG